MIKEEDHCVKYTSDDPNDSYYSLLLLPILPFEFPFRHYIKAICSKCFSGADGIRRAHVSLKVNKQCTMEIVIENWN